ncbi:DUF4361 domain-containing protein [Proteiniphilum sp.]|uniref:BT_3044 domain-containing protein n=1 Tax=Proteiniphilum sp. TaxID=1926877 RepID=UPI00332EBB97
MKNILYLELFLITLVPIAISSCDIDDVYKKEQYKKVIALVSNEDYNVFPVVHDLYDPESTGYVGASCGGTHPSDEMIYLSLSLNTEVIEKFNINNYDVDISKYAKMLPEEMYTIDSYEINIPAGDYSGRMKISVRPEGLSPDSIYFIPLKISNSTYEVNPDKDYVLYRVLIKNKWATQESITNYTMRAIRNTTQLPGTKRMDPISRNKVRVMVSNVAFESDLDKIEANGMYLEIGEDNRVTITPVKELQVTQIDGDTEYPNIYRVDDDGYKRYHAFLLHYSYKQGTDTFEMREELRLEIKDNLF